MSILRTVQQVLVNLFLIWLGFTPACLRAASVYIGKCDLSTDPEGSLGSSVIVSDLCLRGNLGVESTLIAESPREDSWSRYGKIYGGYYLTPRMSLHILGKWREILPLKDRIPSSNSIYTDFALVEVGNPALDRYRITFGRLRLPFGIDQSSAPEFYQEMENRQLWDSPRIGSFLTFDDLRRIHIEIGIASRSLDAFKVSHPLTENGDRAVSIRSAIDSSALEGTRFIFSGYARDDGERRYGLGLINKNQKDDTTEFEFIRRLASPDGAGAATDQLLRLSYVSAWRRAARWVVQYDDERYRFRRLIIDYDKEIVTHLITRIAVAYISSQENNKGARFTMTLGVETSL